MIRFRRLLVPHDLSVHSDEALGAAAELAGPQGDILVLHAVMPIVPPGVSYAPIDTLIRGDERYLKRVVADRIGASGPRTTVKVVVGDPFHRIMENTRDRDAVVMSTRGRTGLAHLVIGSVAEKTVRHSPIPVLTLRPQRVRGAGRSGASAAPRRAA